MEGASLPVVSPWARRIAVILAVAYPVGLVLAWVLLRFSGDRWWIPLVGLYAPPFGFLLPAPIILLLVWRWAGLGWLALQVVAVALTVFGLLGLHLGLGRDVRAAQDPRALRIVSYNIDSGVRGLPGIVAQIMAMHPNVVLMQELDEGLAPALGQAFAGWHTDLRGQFFVASRFPILEVKQPPALHDPMGEGGHPHAGPDDARFVSTTLDTPLGRIEVFNVHTTSPREGLEDMRGAGFLYELRHGHVLLGRHAERLKLNATLRRRQVENLAATARTSPHPVILAGDFNLPGLSRVMRDNLADFDDGFTKAGRGFGYTYPTRLPFLRLDRIFAGRGLRVADFQVGQTRASDHLCVSAVITGPS